MTKRTDDNGKTRDRIPPTYGTARERRARRQREAMAREAEALEARMQQA